MTINRSPQHIAIIMDGNGRWAKARGLPRIEGHRQGVETAENIITAVKDLGIPWLTLYAFSDENWDRPREEVDALMALLEVFLKTRQQKMIRNGIRFRTIGDTAKLPGRIRQVIAETREVTQNGTATTLVLALSYGARDEIVRAVNRILGERRTEIRRHGGTETRKMENGKPVTEGEFAKYLDTAQMPDPDLLIRTSGEYRLSNYLLWQTAYTELYFTKTMWPDFSPQELEKALEEYAKRERRFGKTSEQLQDVVASVARQSK